MTYKVKFIYFNTYFLVAYIHKFNKHNNSKALSDVSEVGRRARILVR